MSATLNTLYELAEDLRDIIIAEYAKYSDVDDVKPLPDSDNIFIVIGSMGTFPQTTTDQLAVYIGAPFPGIAQQGDSTACLSPTSTLMAVDLTRCYPQPQVSQRGGRINNDKFRDELEQSVKQQSNDMLIIRDAMRTFYDIHGAGEGNLASIEVALGQDQSGALLHITCSTQVLLAMKAGEINGRLHSI
jgi:hypothetical protein